MNVFDFLRSDGFIPVNKKLAKTIGLHETIVFAELCFLHNYYKDRDQLDDDGWFYCTVENLLENTTLSEHQQGQAIKKLVKIGLVEYKVRGLPAKRHFRLSEENLMRLFWNKNPKNSGTDNTNGSSDSGAEKAYDIQNPKNSGTSAGKIPVQAPEKFGNKNSKNSAEKRSDLKRTNKKAEEDTKRKAQAPSSSRIEVIEQFKRNASNDLPNDLLNEISHEMEIADFDFDFEAIRQTCIVAFDKFKKGEVYRFKSYFISVLKEKGLQRKMNNESSVG